MTGQTSEIPLLIHLIQDFEWGSVVADQFPVPTLLHGQFLGTEKHLISSFRIGVPSYWSAYLLVPWMAHSSW